MSMTRMRFGLREALFTIALIAIVLSFAKSFQAPMIEVSYTLRAVDGNTERLRAFVLSSEVLDSVLNEYRHLCQINPRGTDHVPKDREELLDRLCVTASPSSNTVRVSMVQFDSRDFSTFLVYLIIDHCTKTLGSTRVVLAKSFTATDKSRSDLQDAIRLMLLFTWFSAFRKLKPFRMR